ncbi:MAG: hypothetical protein MJE77_30865 [Proteobacteria bacterium]|nr:hypothetical protein [Pseudomonadota bacterium]
MNIDRRVRVRTARITLILAIVAGFMLGACADDIRYLKQDEVLEAGGPDDDPDLAVGQLVLPIRIERTAEHMKRMELATQSGLAVPYVRLNDLSLSIEWTVKNLSADDGTARISVNGGNESNFYVPDDFALSRDEVPPPLMGGIPLPIPANGTISGVFREDEVREAAIDLTLITRAGYNAFAAVLEQHDDIDDFVGGDNGLAVPEQFRDRAEEFVGSLVQFDVSFEANRHMAVEYTVRVRDHRDLLHKELLDAPRGELTAFVPARASPMAEAME